MTSLLEYSGKLSAHDRAAALGSQSSGLEAIGSSGGTIRNCDDDVAVCAAGVDGLLLLLLLLAVNGLEDEAVKTDGEPEPESRSCNCERPQTKRRNRRRASTLSSSSVSQNI